MHRTLTATLLAACALAGCSWGHQDRLAYDALAREAIDAEIAATARKIRCEIHALPVATDTTARELPEPAKAIILKNLRSLESRADQGVQRARIAQLYHGSPRETEVQLGQGKDQMEVVALAGLATERQAKRGWAGRKLKDLATGVAAFAADLTASTATTVVQAIIPGWLLWCLGVACVIALAIGLYALWQWLVVRRKDKALDEYDEAIEQLPKEQRLEIGKGLRLQIEHAARNALRHARNREWMRRVLPLEEEKAEHTRRLESIGEMARRRASTASTEPIPQEALPLVGTRSVDRDDSPASE